MIPGSKGLNPHELAHRWVKDIGENCESAQHGTIRRYQSRGLLTPTSCYLYMHIVSGYFL